MDTLEGICFKIISAVGSARSMYVGAIQEAKQGNIAEAQKMMDQGSELFAKGHLEHLQLFQMQMSKEFTLEHVLLMHAEDQLMSAEAFKIIAEEFIDLYSLLNK